MIESFQLDEIIDVHLDKRLTNKRAQKIKSEILAIVTKKKRLKNKGSRTATVAIPNEDGSLSVKQVKPARHGDTPRNSIVIGHPEADE